MILSFKNQLIEFYQSNLATTIYKFKYYIYKLTTKKVKIKLIDYVSIYQLIN